MAGSGQAAISDHADTATYLHWLQAARLTPIWDRYIPEGSSGYTLVLTEASSGSA